MLAAKENETEMSSLKETGREAKQLFRHLLRARQQLFSGDKKALDASAIEIRSHFDANRNVTDEEEIKKFQLRNGEFEIEENGDTNYYEVPNDYIIVNENPKMRTFELTDSTALKFHPFYGDTLIDFKNTNSALERVTLNPYYIVTANGKVKELSEIFVP